LGNYSLDRIAAELLRVYDTEENESTGADQGTEKVLR